MKKKAIAIILGFILIILASTLPLIYNSDLGGYVTVFEEIKFRLWLLRVGVFS